MQEENDRLSWEDVFQHSLFGKTDWEDEIKNLKETAENFSFMLMEKIKIKENDINISSFFKNLKHEENHLNFQFFQEFIKSAELNLTNDQINFIFKEVDENKDGMISKTEFIKWIDLANYCRYKIIKESSSTLDQILKQNYINEETKCDLENFKNLPLIKEFLKEMNDYQLQLIFNSIDLDKSGKISFLEFKNWLDLPKYFREIIKKDLFAAKYNCHKLFELVDRNQIGMIDKKQFKDFLKKIKPNMLNEHIDFIFSSIDKDNDKYISEQEFNKWLEPVDFLRDIFNQKISVKNLDLREFFQKIDKDNDGALNQEEFQEFILTIDQNLENLSSIIFESIDGDNNGKIDFQEFIFWLANSRTPKQAFSKLLFYIKDNKKSLDNLFNNFSKNRESLNKDQFRDLCNTVFKEKFTFTEYDALFYQFEMDNNGEINFINFCKKINN